MEGLKFCGYVFTNPVRYMSEYMKAVLQKEDNIKIKRNVSLFFSPHASLFYFFIAWSDFKAFWSSEIKVHMAILVQSLDTVFINSVIPVYIYQSKG